MTQRIKRHPFLALFDGPDPNTSTAGRQTTTVADAGAVLPERPVRSRAGREPVRAVARAAGSGPPRPQAYRLLYGRPPRRPRPRDCRAVPHRSPPTEKTPGFPGCECCSAVTSSFTSISRGGAGGRGLLHEELRHGGSSTTRRGFLRSAVAGTAVSGARVGTARVGRPWLAAAAGRPALRAEGQERHLPVHERRGVARRFVRPMPKLTTDHGKQVELDHPGNAQPPGVRKTFLKRPQWAFEKRGKCGTEMQRPVPASSRSAGRPRRHPVDARRPLEPLQRHARDAHRVVQPARPSMGRGSVTAWAPMNRNLPSFVVIAPHTPYAGGQVWASDFLPGSHQGTPVLPQRRADAEHPPAGAGRGPAERTRRAPPN